MSSNEALQEALFPALICDEETVERLERSKNTIGAGERTLEKAPEAAADVVAVEVVPEVAVEVAPLVAEEVVGAAEKMEFLCFFMMPFFEGWRNELFWSALLFKLRLVGVLLLLLLMLLLLLAAIFGLEL